MIGGAALVLLSFAIIIILVYMSRKEGFGDASYVRQYKGKGMMEPGNFQSLEVLDPKASFPFPYQGKKSELDPGKISLVNSEGVIINGYRPQIVRPMDCVSANPAKDSNCQWPCYSDKKFQTWCSEENAIKYHAMRPIISPEKYNENLKKMFAKMIDKRKEVPDDSLFGKTEEAVFCNANQKSLMAWLMKKVALAVSKMPEMQRNGSWKDERFYDMDVQMYQYKKEGEKGLFAKILFNLYNPLRSVATWVVATLYIEMDEEGNGEPFLIDMDFVNTGLMGDYMGPSNGFGSISSQELPAASKNNMRIENYVPLGVENSPSGMKKYGEEYKKNPNEFDWNYMNTLEVQKFNDKGFHSNVESDNIEIEGGIPESLRKIINDDNPCKYANVMSCSKADTNGVKISDGNISAPTGSVKYVYNNPTVTYTGEDGLVGRPVETPNGLIYI